MANWWNAPKYGAQYNNWWNNDFKTQGLNQNPDVSGDDAAHDPFKDASGFFEYLVDPSGEGGQYGVMSPYTFRSGQNRAQDWYDNFLTETLANMQNTDNVLGNVTTTEDFANYMKARMNPAGYQSGTALGVPGSATAGQYLQPGFVYSPEQSQAMTRTAIQNMIDAYGTYKNKSDAFTNFSSVYTAANSALNGAYNTALDAFKTETGSDVSKGFTDANFRTLLSTGAVTVTDTATGQTKTLTLKPPTNADPNYLNSIKLLFSLTMPTAGASTTAGPSAAFSLPTTAFTAANASQQRVGTIAQAMDQLTGQAGTGKGLWDAIKAAEARAQAAGYTMNGVDYGNVLSAISGGNQAFEGKYNAWAPNAAEQTANTIMYGGTTGTPDSNRLYQMLWTGLGGGYGGAFRTALQDQFHKRVNALTSTMAGNGGSYLDQLMQLFNTYAARQGAH
jgi:hypothetical protein